MLNKKVNRNYFCRGLCTSLATTGMPAAFFPLCDIYRAMLMLECNNKTKKTLMFTLCSMCSLLGMHSTVRL